MSALSGPDRDQLRQRLFSSVNIACQIEDLPLTREQIGDIADFLLPVVLATQAAELDRMAELLESNHDRGPARRCRNRSQALRTHEGDPT